MPCAGFRRALARSSSRVCQTCPTPVARRHGDDQCQRQQATCQAHDAQHRTRPSKRPQMVPSPALRREQQQPKRANPGKTLTHTPQRTRFRHRGGRSAECGPHLHRADTAPQSRRLVRRRGARPAHPLQRRSRAALTSDLARRAPCLAGIARLSPSPRRNPFARSAGTAGVLARMRSAASTSAKGPIRRREASRMVATCATSQRTTRARRRRHDCFNANAITSADRSP